MEQSETIGSVKTKLRDAFFEPKKKADKKPVGDAAKCDVRSHDVSVHSQ